MRYLFAATVAVAAIVTTGIISPLAAQQAGSHDVSPAEFALGINGDLSAASARIGQLGQAAANMQKQLEADQQTIRNLKTEIGQLQAKLKNAPPKPAAAPLSPPHVHHK